jgi:hypothetical protein
MSIEQLLNKNIDRRQFLKETGKVTAGLAGLLSSCAPSLRETRQDVINQKGDCNPILPIPAEGCYTGTNYQPAPYVSSYSRTPDGRMLLTAHPPGEREEERVIDGFINRYGMVPTFHAIGSGRHGASNDHFPENICRAAVQRGVIPVIRYVVIPFDDCYRQILKGKFDDKFKKFAADTARFEHPVVLGPFQLANDPDNRCFRWAGYPSGQYKDAWVRMHGIFQKEGANKNTIWSSKMKMGMWKGFSYPDPFSYLPDSPYIDIIGWACNNHSKPHIGLYSMSFDDFFEYYYRRASKLFPKKPQMFWELSTPYGPEQASWLDKALGTIPVRYRKVKGVMLDEQYDPGVGDSYGSYNPTPTAETIEVIKKHFSSGYFIGSAIKK